MRRVLLAALAVLCAAANPAVAGEWVYPSASVRGADGIERFPTTDGRLFDSIFEREAYLRERRGAARQAKRLERSAGPVPRAAAPASPDQRIGRIPDRSESPRTALSDPVFAPLPATGDPALDQRRLDEAIARARAIRDFERRRSTLSEISRGDSATSRRDIAAARAAGQRRTAQGAHRLQAGAAAGRATLGERDMRSRTPLIRMPRVALP